MRVLFLNYEFPPIGGGGANATSYLFQEFAKSPGLSVDCVTSAWRTGDVEERLADNIRLLRLDVGKRDLHYWTQYEVLTWLFRSYKKARALVQEHDYDVCHAFFGFPSGMIAWLLRDRCPYLVSLRGSDVPGFNPRFAAQYVLLKPLFRKIWASAGAVIANSEGLQRLASELTPDLPLDIIPNGIDVKQFAPSDHDAKIPGRILCVSRLVERKGVHHLVEAMPVILNAHPEAHLLIVGEGKQSHYLQRRCRELELTSRVEFCGYVAHDDLPLLYDSAELFVLPSFYEGMSNTVLEAMASGLPIVATGEGGKEELLKENAATTSFGDSAGLGHVICNLLADKGRLQLMGQISREIAEQYSWASVAEGYLEIYNKLVTSRPASRVPRPGF